MMGRRKLLTLFAGAVAVAAAVAFATGQGDAVRRIVAGVGDVDPIVAGLGLLVSALAIANRGLLNHASHHAVGLDAGVEDMTRTTAVGFAAQKLVKSAGMIGLTVFVRHGRRSGYSPAAVVAACILSAAASFVALGVLLTTAIGVLAATGRLEGWWIAAVVGFGLYSAVIGAIVLVVVRSRRLAEVLWHRCQRLGQWIVHRVRRSSGRHRAHTDLPAELFDAVREARHRPRDVRRLLVHAVAGKLLGAAMLGVAVAAVGLPISPGGVLVVYAGALAASMVSIVPGGLGTVEGSTAALLVASGATAGAAALAVALFRLFDLWMPVAIGALASRSELRSIEAASAASARPEVNATHAELFPVPAVVLAA